MRSPGGRRALAVGVGAKGSVLPGDVEEGVVEEVSEAFTQGGYLDEGACPDGLAGA